MANTEDHDLEASVPLLTRPDSDDGPDFEDKVVVGSELLQLIDDPMTYTLPWLKRWDVFYIYKKTVWDNPALWALMGKLMIVAALVCILMYNLMPDPQLLDASKFSAITKVLTLFVTLMLSFFLSSSVNRWVSCVAGFHDLFNAIRNLSMQLNALGAEEEDIKDCLRYGVLSTKFLIQELRSVQMTPEKKQRSLEIMWKDLCHGQYAIRQNERKTVEPLHDKAGQMWMWVASLIGAMACKGDIPPMQSPTYGRIMNLASQGQHGLRQVRTEITVQMPFIYVHTLAVLVHLNSILLAINLGLGAGVIIHSIRLYVHHYYYTEHPDPNVQMEPLTAQIQALIIELFRGVLGPLLFQAFFNIAIAISAPFSEATGAIPIGRLMKALEQDIAESFEMSHRVLWEKPVFNKNRAVANAEESKRKP